MENSSLFKLNHMAGGYSVAVRNRWSHNVHWEHITAEERKIYIETIGDKILFEDDFFIWWQKHSPNSEANKPKEA